MLLRESGLFFCGLLFCPALIGQSTFVIDDDLDEASAEDSASAEGMATLLLQTKHNLSRLSVTQVLSGSTSSQMTLNMTSDSNASYNMDARTFQTVLTSAHSEIMYELDLHGERKAGTKSKVALAVLNGLCLGLCGIDRCYLGQPCIGTIKALTFGGLGFWMIIDYIIILVNCFQQTESINVFGMHAIFNTENNEVTTAFYLSILFLVFQLCGGCGCGLVAPKQTQMSVNG